MSDPDSAVGRGVAVYLEFQRNRDIRTLESAITLFRQAVADAPAGDRLRPQCLANLGSALVTRFDQTGQRPDLDEAIDLLTEAVGSAAADDPNRPVILINLGQALGARIGLSDQPADMEQAAAVARATAETFSPGHPGRAAYLALAANAPQPPDAGTGRSADLDEDIATLTQAVAAAPAGSPERLAALEGLGGALSARYERDRRLSDLDQVIAVACEAAVALPPGHPARARYEAITGNGLWRRFGQTRESADLEEAITLLTRAADSAWLDDPDRLRTLSALAEALGARFRREGRRADVDQAIACLGAAAAATPHDHLDRPRHLANLGAALEHRFELTGDRRDLDEAIARLGEALDAATPGHPDRSAMLSSRSVALQARFEADGQQADLDQAIAASREAVRGAPAGQGDQPAYLSVLGNGLHRRYLVSRQRADLDEAIAALAEAANATPSDHPGRTGMLANLGAALRSRYRRAGQQADLEEAITLITSAVDATAPGHPARPGYLSSLALALYGRYRLTGDRASLDLAIAAVRRAAEEAPPGHTSRPALLVGLSSWLGARAAWWHQEGSDGSARAAAEDLEEAINAVRAALEALPDGHPDRAGVLGLMGSALQARHELSGQPADLEEALNALREGAGVATAPPGERMITTTTWGLCAMRAGDPDSALAAYTLAIELLPLLAWHGLSQETREELLRRWSALASDAAAAAVAAGQPERAVELLEAGRSVIWNQALNLRQDLSEIQGRAPDLAAALEASRAILDAPTTGDPGAFATGDDAPRLASAGRMPHEQRALEARRQAARDWDEAVARVRTLEGFKHFLLPVPLARLLPAADGGPVVIVNISQYASHALVVTPKTGQAYGGPVLVVPLPDAATRTVTDQANILLKAIYHLGDPAVDWSERETDRHTVYGVLEWCWHAVAEPVLTALRFQPGAPDAIGDWPRIWWCPTGHATVLPLHAAGRHPRTAGQHAAMGEAAAVSQTVAGRVVSSYTPTLSALVRARARVAPDKVRQLAVGVPDAPGYASGAQPLPAVRTEFQVLASRLPAAVHSTILLSPAATKEAVLEALPGHSWLHPSCHGFQDQVDATRSAFLLDDEQLTLADFAALTPRDGDLAYLAACQTAAGDLELPDESRHLAGVLRLVGYRHVLATLWSVADAAAPLMADMIYARLAHENPDRPGADEVLLAARAPYALHHAVTSLRQAHPDEPLLWAPYIHLGP